MHSRRLFIVFLLFQPTFISFIETLTPCQGAFDLIFILDRSSSVGSHFQDDTVPFVRKVSESFVSPLLGTSFISFSDAATLHLNVTTDRWASSLLDVILKLKCVQNPG
eukprot:m.145046 g.145046  ORF g.145046 m.145046 type:complete len:108 (+) comp38409_c0_seq5:18-341(+)